MEKLNKAGALLSHGFKSISGKITGKSHNELNVKMYHSILGLCSNKNAVETSDTIVKNPEINHSKSRDEIIERLERIENLLKQKSEVQNGRKMSSVPRNSNRRPSGRKPSISEKTMRAYGGSVISIKELKHRI